MRRKEYEGRESKAKVVTTEVKDWSNFRNADPNAQKESGSMDYLKRNDAIASEDDRTIARFHKDIKSARS